MNQTKDLDTKEVVKQIVGHLKGCSSHDCVVNGPRGGMGAGMCKCISSASRFELAVMESRIKAILGQIRT